MKRPNFFIVGAPKCGTTTLAGWLSDHPQVYVSPIKEPHFFNTDQAYVLTPSLKEYERLFQRANESHVAIGEASVYYAYSPKALSAIDEYSPNAKLIFCIRNPYRMVTSLHRQHVYAGFEDVTEFSAAWRTHRDRIQKNQLPARCPDPIHIDYVETCKLGSVLERLLAAVPRDRLLVQVLDDVAADPLREYFAVCDFLGVSHVAPRSLDVRNKAKEQINPRFHQVLRSLGRVKRRLGVVRGFGILNRLALANTRTPPEPVIAQDVARDLAQVFEPEIEKLSVLLGRDLSSWKP